MENPVGTFWGQTGDTIAHPKPKWVQCKSIANWHALTYQEGTCSTKSGQVQRERNTLFVALGSSPIQLQRKSNAKAARYPWGQIGEELDSVILSPRQGTVRPSKNRATS
jgi:hypothetical protein